MAAIALRDEERIGLGVAIAAHATLVALIVLRPPTSPMLPPPERIAVTLSDEVGLTDTSPDPAAEGMPDVAPELGEPAPPEQVEEVRPEPRTEPMVEPRPQPMRPSPRQARPEPRPERRPTPPRKVEAPRPPAKAASSSPTKVPPRDPPKQAGASRIGDDFLKGDTTSPGRTSGAPAAEIGPNVQSSLRSAVSRQLKPHWAAPQGADADQLVTIVRFRLARDGSLVGSPQVIDQSGVTPSNIAQKGRHAEQAIRAVRLAAPFDLPEQYYSAWQTVTSRFDRRLSQ